MANIVLNKRLKRGRWNYYVSFDDSLFYRSGWYSESRLFSILKEPNPPEIRVTRPSFLKLEPVIKKHSKIIRSFEIGAEIDGLSMVSECDIGF